MAISHAKSVATAATAAMEAELAPRKKQIFEQRGVAKPHALLDLEKAVAGVATRAASDSSGHTTVHKVKPSRPQYRRAKRTEACAGGAAPSRDDEDRQVSEEATSAAAERLARTIFVGNKFSLRRGAAADAGTEEDKPTGTASMQPKRSVFLGNLSFETQEEDLWRHFECCGSIEYVRLVRDPQTQQGRGFGYVCFKEKGAVDLALERHLCQLRTHADERPIRVFRCFKNKRSAEKTPGRPFISM